MADHAPKDTKAQPQPQSSALKSTPSGGGGRSVQLKAALRGLDYEAQVQMLSPEGPQAGESSVHAAAEKGVSGSASRLPHSATIQNSFQGYDISNIQAHLDPAAHAGATAMGAEAYATGDRIAFANASPDLHTAAHEATHVIQQKAGVSLSGGVGKTGDKYERQADDVADLVVQRKSAAGLLGEISGGAGSANCVQMREDPTLRLPPDEGKSDEASVVREQAPQKEDPSSKTSSTTIDVALAAARLDADSAREDLGNAMHANILEQFYWLSKNLSEYITDTGGGGQVDFTAGAALKKAVGLTGAGVKAGGRAAGGAVASSVAGKVAEGAAELSRGMKALAFVASSATSVIVSAVWGILEAYLEKTRVGAAVHAATQQVGQAFDAALDGAKGRCDALSEAWIKESMVLKAGIFNATDLAALSNITEMMRGNTLGLRDSTKKLAGDRSLYAEMIHKWLMETAKDETDGGQDVLAEDYSAARSKVLTDKEITPSSGNKDLLYNPARIFVEQCRYEWNKLGVDATEALATLTSIYEQQKTAKPEARPTGGAGQMYDVVSEIDPTSADTLGLLVQALVGRGLNQTFQFKRVKDPAALNQYLALKNVIPAPGTVERAAAPKDGDSSGPDRLVHSPNTLSLNYKLRRILNAAENGVVRIDCNVDIVQKDGGAHVSKFAYDMFFSARGDGEVIERLEAAP